MKRKKIIAAFALFAIVALLLSGMSLSILALFA